MLAILKFHYASDCVRKYIANLLILVVFCLMLFFETYIINTVAFLFIMFYISIMNLKDSFDRLSQKRKSILTKVVALRFVYHNSSH